MSGVADVRSYFKARLNNISLKEWKVAFEEEIPENIIDRAYHVIHGAVVVVRNDHTNIELHVPVSANVYLKGFRDTMDGFDRAAILIDQVLAEVLKIQTRLTQSTSIKNILLESVETGPLNPENLNIMKIVFVFNAFVIINP